MWVVNLPWVEVVVGCNGKLNMVCCKICKEFDGREKLLVLKFDSLQKHVGWRKCKVTCLRVIVGQYFMSTNSQHAKNE